MPQLCSVRGCKSALRKNSGISFHCFPKDEKMRQVWLRTKCFGVLKWNRRPRVCCMHFNKEDFVMGGNVAKLSKFAVPNVLSVNNTSPSPSSSNTSETTSSNTMENTPLMPETGPAICTSPSPVTTDNALTTVTPHIPCYKVRAVRNRNHQAYDSTSKVFNEVSMTWVSGKENGDLSLEEEHTLTSTNIVQTLPKVTTKRRMKAVSEALTNSLETSIVNMSWISDQPSDQPNQAKDGNMLTTSTPKKQKPHVAELPITLESTNLTLNEENDCTDVSSCNQSCSNLRTVTILENKVAYLKQENIRLQQLSMPKPLFCLEQFSANDKKILYYTGFQTYDILSIVFKYVLPSGDVKDMNIHVSPETRTVQRLSKLSAENQFFLTLIRLRRGMPIETISDLFSISKACADSIFLSWVNLLYLRLGSLDIWPNRNELIKRASDSMREKYPNIIGSIDCTEFFIQRPSSLVKQSQCYSNYKGMTTLKSLIMIDPAGAIIYASPLYTGSISDKAIIEDSGFIDILKEKVNKGQISPGDTILADKGFNVRDLFEAIQLDLNIPVFRVSGTQFGTEEVLAIRKVAQERIHVERAIGRLKNYKILSSKIPISSLGSIEQIYTVCVLLSNFRYGLIQ